MSKHARYTPKHRGRAARPGVQAQKKAVRTTVVLSALAVAGTGSAVAGGVAISAPSSTDKAPEAAADLPAPPATLDPEELEERTVVTSRSGDRRERTDPTKRAAIRVVSRPDATALTRSEDIADADPRTIASAMLSDYGWDSSQFGCLDSLWDKESGWSVTAANPVSSAYGIPQALPGSKMASAGSDWATNPATQIEWGLGYIQDRYGSPCGAWSHSQSYNWY